jgi:uncharacterized protein (DUF2126 family)
VLIGETLRHLHAERSGNNHRSEISINKFWHPGVPSGCLGLIEFRTPESMPRTARRTAVAPPWSALATLLLDRALLPSALAADLRAVLSESGQAGLPLGPAPFEAIWNRHFSCLLHWQLAGAVLELREALEPWPLICDGPREGGFTSRFVVASLRRFEIRVSAQLRQRCRLRLNGRPLPLDPQPLAVCFRRAAPLGSPGPVLPAPDAVPRVGAVTGAAMHTHDLENHDNLYADEVPLRIGESGADARGHALWAVATIALMVVGLGIGLIVS